MGFIALNSLMNASTNALFELVIKFLIFNIIPAFRDLILAPLINPEMIWIVIPLITSMILMQLYFARNRNEELGWGSAFGNSISLIFVSLNLFQFLFNQYGWQGINPIIPLSNKLYLVLIILSISIIQLIINFYHLIPKKIAFFINSTIPTNVTAYFSIIIIYTGIKLNLETIIASFFLFFSLIIIFKWIARFIPMSSEARNYVEIKSEKEKRKKAWLERMGLRQEKAEGARLKDALIIIILTISLISVLTYIESIIRMPLWFNPLIQSITYIILTITLLKIEGLSITNLNYDRRISELLIGLLMGIPLLFISSGIVYLLSFTLDIKSLINIGMNYASIPLIYKIIIFVFLVPLSNELLFRGLLQRSLKAKIGFHAGVIIQAITYTITGITLTLIQGNYYLITLIPLLVSGILLGYLREYFGLDGSIGAHVMFNLIGTILI